jgi:hypothetical protein
MFRFLNNDFVLQVPNFPGCLLRWYWLGLHATGQVYHALWGKMIQLTFLHVIKQK